MSIFTDKFSLTYELLYLYNGTVFHNVVEKIQEKKSFGKTKEMPNRCVN